MKGYYVQRLNSGMIPMGEGRSRRMIRLVKSGTPDIMAFRVVSPEGAPNKGEIDLVFIEVKRPKKKPTPLQILKMEELKSFGARCIVAHSVEEVEEAL